MTIAFIDNLGWLILSHLIAGAAGIFLKEWIASMWNKRKAKL